MPQKIDTLLSKKGLINRHLVLIQQNVAPNSLNFQLVSRS